MPDSHRVGASSPLNLHTGLIKLSKVAITRVRTSIGLNLHTGFYWAARNLYADEATHTLLNLHTGLVHYAHTLRQFSEPSIHPSYIVSLLK